MFSCKPGTQWMVLSCWNASGVEATDDIKSLSRKELTFIKCLLYTKQSTYAVLLTLELKTPNNYVLFTTMCFSLFPGD